MSAICHHYYRFDNYRAYEDTMVNEEIITLGQAIELIRKSVGDEKEDEMFYDELIKNAPNQKEKDIIASIRDEERKARNVEETKQEVELFINTIKPYKLSYPAIVDMEDADSYKSKNGVS